ncbi:MAG TPA: DUF1700 domain-containing protein [Clostridiales bacterium]|nr:DUF1700 domain-containing protein [Clostridiales bacterium]
MTKSEFLTQLRYELKKNNISDSEDILDEYEQHFAFKLADGFAEEEIAAKLGNPYELASQFIPNEEQKKHGGRKIVTVIGMVFADIFVGAFFLILYAFAAVMGTFTIAAAFIGICLLTGLNISNLIPGMPYLCALIYVVCLLALALLSSVGCLYFVSFIKQLMRSYGRFHFNVIAGSAGQAMLPSLPVYPRMSAKSKRRTRLIALFSLTVFAVSFIAGYIISAILAGSLEFWHVWGWFI